MMGTDTSAAEASPSQASSSTSSTRLCEEKKDSFSLDEVKCFLSMFGEGIKDKRVSTSIIFETVMEREDLDHI